MDEMSHWDNQLVWKNSVSLGADSTQVPKISSCKDHVYLFSLVTNSTFHILFNKREFTKLQYFIRWTLVTYAVMLLLDLSYYLSWNHFPMSSQKCMFVFMAIMAFSGISIPRLFPMMSDNLYHPFIGLVQLKRVHLEYNGWDMNQLMKNSNPLFWKKNCASFP